MVANIMSSILNWMCLKQRTRQKEDDHHRVDDGEPVDLDITHGQVGVPPRGPLDLALLFQRESEQESERMG